MVKALIAAVDVDPGEVLIDSVNTGLDANLPKVLGVVAVLIGVGVVVALVRRYIPGA